MSFWKKRNDKTKNQKERKRRYTQGAGPSSPMDARTFSRKASPAPLRRGLVKGSLTVECAFALPLFFFAMTAMISMMDIYRIETVHLSNLCKHAKEAAAFTYNPAGEGLQDIILPDFYTCPLVGGMIPLRSVSRLNTVKVRSWNGSEHEIFHDSLVSDNMVYVTASGTVYHRSLGCRYLNVALTQISSGALATSTNRYGQRYSACELCASSGIPAPMVYVTAGGNRYHNAESCSGLKRTIRMIRESQAGSLRPCSSCGG